MVEFDDAFALSESLLAEPLPDRWRHVQAVAREASRLGGLEGIDAEDLRVAAILHDIGYAPTIAHERFHPLDGVRFLAREGYPDRVVALVARHSGAAVEAELRQIDGVEDYVDEVSSTRDALWYCDATTGPQGQRLTPDECAPLRPGPVYVFNAVGLGGRETTASRPPGAPGRSRSRLRAMARRRRPPGRASGA